MNGEKTHSDYIETGLEDLEFNVLEDNGLIEELKKGVPDYNEAELKVAKYKLYYRGFPLWKISCAEQYATEDLAKLGDDFA